MICRFANEAVLCLEEGIIDSIDEGDAAAVFAVGFPFRLGGPFFMIDCMTAKVFVEKMREFERAYGARYQVCETLLKMADNDGKFYK